MCRTELGEEATKTRVKTDTAEPPLALLSDMNNKGAGGGGAGYRQADHEAVWSQPRGQDGGLAGMTFNFATRSVELEAPLSRADRKKSDKSLNLSPQPPSSHLPHTAASSTTLRLPSEQQ